MNSLVLSDEQREQATDAAVRRLIALVPRANFVGSDGGPRFVGSADAAVDEHTWRSTCGRTPAAPTSSRRVGSQDGGHIEPERREPPFPGLATPART